MPATGGQSHSTIVRSPNAPTMSRTDGVPLGTSTLPDGVEKGTLAALAAQRANTGTIGGDSKYGDLKHLETCGDRSKTDGQGLIAELAALGQATGIYDKLMAALTDLTSSRSAIDQLERRVTHQGDEISALRAQLREQETDQAKNAAAEDTLQRLRPRYFLCA